MSIKNKVSTAVLGRLPAALKIRLKFLLKLGYWPDLSDPKTYNEKLNYRKLNWKNDLFPDCCDKVLVREYVKERVGSEILIPAFYTGKTIEKEDVLSSLDLCSRVVIKSSNDAGSVYFVTSDMSDKEILSTLSLLKKKQENQFANTRSEEWYSGRERKYIIEKNIKENEDSLQDYKFHVFKRKGKQPCVIVHVDYNRFTSERSRTFYNDNFEVLEISQAPFKNFYKPFPVDMQSAKNMKELAIKLANDFSYARVDLYHYDGAIYFGEITFAPGSGFTKFTDYNYDRLLGSYWECDPCY